MAQGPSVQQKVAEVKAAMAKNQKALAQYTWQQRTTVSVRGEVRKQDVYQVSLGANGKPVKTVINQGGGSSDRKFGIRHRITEDYEQYGKQIADLAQSYTQTDPGKLQQLTAQGNVALKASGTPGIESLVISNYLKQGDSVTINFNRTQKAVSSIRVASYLSAPSDVVTINAQFAKLPDGTNHISTANVLGQSKSLNVQQVNTNYQKR